MEELKNLIKSKQTGIAWKHAVKKSGDSRWYALMDVLFDSIDSVMTYHPDWDEEVLFTEGVNYIGDQLKEGFGGVKKLSRAHFSQSIQRYLKAYGKRECENLPFSSLEAALHQGDDVTNDEYVDRLVYKQEVREIFESAFIHALKYTFH